jgi:hypothetical protein
MMEHPLLQPVTGKFYMVVEVGKLPMNLNRFVRPIPKRLVTVGVKFPQLTRPFVSRPFDIALAGIA